MSCRPKFFLPVQVLGCLFKGKLLDSLREAFDQGKLRLNGQLSTLAEPAQFHAWLDQLGKPDWVVYAKPPFGGPEHVIKYLAPLYPSRRHLQWPLSGFNR